MVYMFVIVDSGLGITMSIILVIGSACMLLLSIIGYCTNKSLKELLFSDTTVPPPNTPDLTNI